MTVLTYAQVASVVKKAGFPNPAIGGLPLHVIMTAVCSAESSRRTDVVNSIGCVGLFQINAPVHKKYDARRLKEADYNAKAAREIYGSQGLRAWEAYTNGAYKKYVASAKRGVAQASSVVGGVSVPKSANATAAPAITYGPLAAQDVHAGVGVPLVAAKESASPLSPLRIYGTQMGGDYSQIVIGAPAFEAGIETVPNLKFTIADPGGNLLFRNNNVFRHGARVQYADLDMRIDSITFEPGSHGTGQITLTVIDDIVYGLMDLTGAKTVAGWSATQWLHSELYLAGLSPAKSLLGEAVVTQSQISRDVPDQQGASGSGGRPSSWTTQLRLAKELGKRCFISGKRIVFGSSQFAMRWCAPGALLLSRGAGTEGEKWLNLPTVDYVTVGSRSDVLQVTGKVPFNRALFFRPGVAVAVRNTPSVAGDKIRTFMVSKIAYTLGTDVDGADVTLVEPIDAPKEPPSATAANAGSTASGSYTSGGGADGQVAKFVSLALQQAGDRYSFGAEASPSDPNPRAFDCSELVEWAAARAGITPRVPDGSAAQRAHCERHGTMISIATARKTKGALVFMPGHVAISLGNGKTIEAMTPSQGVRQGNFDRRGWTGAAKIPGAKGYH
jgi:cell wall-associated NlpC family hydrolase